MSDLARILGSLPPEQREALKQRLVQQGFDRINAMRSWTPPPQAAEMVTGMLPGAGDAMAAMDSQAAGQRMVNAFRGGDYSGAIGSGLEALGHGLGALPMVPAFMGTMKAATARAGMQADPNYLYHVTNRERIQDIAAEGKLRTHKPYEFTDQDAWPDGSLKKRAYFSGNPDSTLPFAPEWGDAVMIRVARDKAKFGRERFTGDYFTESPIPSKHLEFLGEDGGWHPLTGGVE
jgi:hypothetical protein